MTLIEKNIALGGRVIHSEELAPNMECSPCMLAPRLFQVKDDPNIRVISYAELIRVVGFHGNFTVTVRARARSVDASCIGCEACFEVCPVSVPSEFHLGLGTRKAIYTLFPGAVPATAVIDREHCLHFKDGSCQACVPACPFNSIHFEEEDQVFEIPAGAVLVATGTTSFNPKAIESLGYPDLPNVITLQEFERLTNSNGPTQGKLLLKNGKPPKSVAVLHCAGSLTPDGLNYCSGICCLTALKVGDVIRKQHPDAKIHNIHDRLVLDGPNAQAFLNHQIKSGTRLISTSQIDRVSVKKSFSGLSLNIPGNASLAVDMVVLATGQEPAGDAQALAQMLALDTTPEGFFRPDHVFLNSLGAGTPGIYMLGSAAGPCLADEAVVRAHAAAGRALSLLVPGKKIDLEMLTSVIDAGLCAGCELCVAACPYSAIAYNQETHACEINEVVCRGCGTCAATCPNNAIKSRHYTREQLNAEIKGLLHEKL